MFLCKLSRKRERHRFMCIMLKSEKRETPWSSDTESLHRTRNYTPKCIYCGSMTYERSRRLCERVGNESSLTSFAAVARAEFSDELYNNLYTNANTSSCDLPVESSCKLTSTHLCHQINLPFMLKSLSLLKSRGVLRREEYEHIRRCIDVHTYKPLLPWLWSNSNYLVLSPPCKLQSQHNSIYKGVKMQNNMSNLIQCSVYESGIDNKNNNNNTLLHSIENLKVIAPNQWQSVVTLQLSELCTLPTQSEYKEIMSLLWKLLRVWQRVFYLIGNNHAFMAAESHQEFVTAHQSLMTVIDIFYQHVNKFITSMLSRLQSHSLSLYEQLCQMNISTLSIMPPRLLLLWRRHYAVQSARHLHAALIQECIIREEALLNVILVHDSQYKGNLGNNTKRNFNVNHNTFISGNSNTTLDQCSSTYTHTHSNELTCDGRKHFNSEKNEFTTSLLKSIEIYSYLLWCATYRGSGTDTKNVKLNTENVERNGDLDDLTSWQALWSRLLACGSFIFPRLFHLHLASNIKMEEDSLNTTMTQLNNKTTSHVINTSSPLCPSSELLQFQQKERKDNNVNDENNVTCSSQVKHDMLKSMSGRNKTNEFDKTQKYTSSTKSSSSSSSSPSRSLVDTYTKNLHALLTSFFKCTVWVKNDNNEAARCVEAIRIIVESYLVAKKQRQMEKFYRNDKHETKQTDPVKQTNEQQEEEQQTEKEDDVNYNYDYDCVIDENSWSLLSLARSVMITQMQHKATQLRFRCGTGLFELYTFASLLELFNPSRHTYSSYETNDMTPMSFMAKDACTVQGNTATHYELPYAMFNRECDLQLLLRSLQSSSSSSSPSFVWRRLIHQCSTLSSDHHEYFPLLKSVKFAITSTLPTLLPSLLRIKSANDMHRQKEMHELKMNVIHQFVKWWEEMTLPLQLGDSYIALREYVKYLTNTAEFKNSHNSNNNVNVNSFCKLLQESRNNQKMSSSMYKSQTTSPTRNKCTWKCGCSFVNASNINTYESCPTLTHYTMIDTKNNDTSTLPPPPPPPLLHASPCLQCSLSHRQLCWMCVKCKNINYMTLGNHELSLIHYPLCSCCGALHPENTELIADQAHNANAEHRPIVDYTNTNDNDNKHHERNVAKSESTCNTNHVAHICLTCNKMCEVMYNCTDSCLEHDSKDVNTDKLSYIDNKKNTSVKSNNINNIIEKYELSYTTPTRPFCLHDCAVQNYSNFFTSDVVLQLKWLCGCGEVNAFSQLYCNKCSNVFLDDSAMEMTQLTKHEPCYTCDNCHKRISLTHSQKDNSRHCNTTTSSLCEREFDGDSCNNYTNTYSHPYWNQLQRIRCPHCSVAHPKYETFCKYMRVIMCPGCHLLVSWMPHSNNNRNVNINLTNSENKKTLSKMMENKTATFPCNDTVLSNHNVTHSNNISDYLNEERNICYTTKQTFFQCPSCHYSCVGKVCEYLTSYVDAPWRCHACGHANNLREPHSGRLMNALRLQKEVPSSLVSSVHACRDENQNSTLTSEKNKRTLPEKVAHDSEKIYECTDVSKVKELAENLHLTKLQNSNLLCDDNLHSATCTYELNENHEFGGLSGGGKPSTQMYKNICETCASCHTERLPTDEFNEWVAWRCDVCAENHVNYGFACDYCFSLHPAFYTPLSECTLKDTCYDTTNQTESVHVSCKADEVFVWRCCVCRDTLNPSWSLNCSRTGCVGTLSMLLSQRIHNSVQCNSNYMFTSRGHSNTHEVEENKGNAFKKLEKYKYQYEIRNCANCGHYASPFQQDKNCKYCHEELSQLKPFVEVTRDNSAVTQSEKREALNWIVYNNKEKMSMNLLNVLENDTTSETITPPPRKLSEPSLQRPLSKVDSKANIHETIAVIKEQPQQEPLRESSKLQHHYSSLVPSSISRQSSDCAKEAMHNINIDETPSVSHANKIHYLNTIEEQLLSAAEHVNTPNKTMPSKRKKKKV